MKQKTIIKTVRFSPQMVEKMKWLKDRKINPNHVLRIAFEKEFSEVSKNYFKEQERFKYPF